MDGLRLKWAIPVMAMILLCSTSLTTQVSPTTKKATRTRVTQGPELERTDSNFAIITWTTSNPGGSPEHYGVVYYGISPKELSHTAKSPIRLNPGHSYTVFRVRMEDLKAGTTYYYKVDSIEANGNSDGVKSPVRHFTTR